MRFHPSKRRYNLLIQKIFLC
ncbi:MAG: hypothetical protein, partial [Olavius algarvensis Gamma 1 endosymbiont]